MVNSEDVVESASKHIKILEDNDFFNFKISCKASDVFLAVSAYYGISDTCDYPLHGCHGSWLIPISIDIGSFDSLLWAGIGDTIRVSLSADPVKKLKDLTFTSQILGTEVSA